MVPNLKNILRKNNGKLIPNRNLGVYKLKCSCRYIMVKQKRKSLVGQ